MCESIRPGITVRPCRSISRVCGPACLRISALVPTAAILPLRMARASRTEKLRSTVRIFPLLRIISGFCARVMRGTATSSTRSRTVLEPLATEILILVPENWKCLIQSLRCPGLAVPIQGLAGRVHRDCANFGELIERFDPGLAPHAAILEPAPRRSGIEPVMIVHPNHAEKQAASHAMRPRHVLGPHRCREAEPCVVSDADGVGFVFKRYYHRHGAEDFLLRDFRVRVGVAQHRWLDEKSGGHACGRPLAAR